MKQKRAPAVQVVTLDGDALERGTSAKLTTLCALRGVSAIVTWDGAQYLANGTPCGRSVHGVYAWLNVQPGVKP